MIKPWRRLAMFDDKQIKKMEKYIKSLSDQEIWELIDQSFGMWRPNNYYFGDNNYTWSLCARTPTS